MKSLSTAIAALFSGLVPVAAQSQDGNRNLEMREVPTHEQLSNALREAQAMNPLNNFKAVEGEDQTEVYRPESLLATSDIISFNGLTTLVPKRAILALPESFKNRIGSHIEGNRVVQFQEFLHANRGWVMAVEVTRAQAQGREQLSESVMERVGKSTSLMVATFQGGPISVLPLRDPEEGESTDEKD